MRVQSPRVSDHRGVVECWETHQHHCMFRKMPVMDMHQGGPEVLPRMQVRW